MSRFDPFEEIIFEVTQDEVDGGYNASALGFSIHTQEIRSQNCARMCGKRSGSTLMKSSKGYLTSSGSISVIKKR